MGGQPRSEWLEAVATVLPMSHREPSPYALGEAAEEFRDYARATSDAAWSFRAAQNNRASLLAELREQAKSLGDGLRALLRELIEELAAQTGREQTALSAARLSDAWHAKSAVNAAFHDLCATAGTAQPTTKQLRDLATILASQLGAAAVSTSSPLQAAADALIRPASYLAMFRPSPLPDPLAERDRLELARNALTDTASGHVIVWTLYRRATVDDFRVVVGPMTFLHPQWALFNAFEDDGQPFAERTELRDIRQHVSWLDDIHALPTDTARHLVLVRVDLGDRQLAGAAEEASRRIDAILGIAVEAGGVSWLRTNASAVLLDQVVRRLTLSPNFGDVTGAGDSYGMHGTALMLNQISDELHDALNNGPMPDRLVEALATLQEARMTDHRDVRFFGARPVSPRVATALEDHAMELIASVLGVTSEDLAIAIQYRITLDRAENAALGQLLAPFNDAWQREDHARRRELEDSFATYSSGHQVVNVSKAVALQDEVRALAMSDLQRADFEQAIRICTIPATERTFLIDVWNETSLLRARHRRVRNAVNHGLPLSQTTLDSVRSYASSASQIALEIALTWFKNGDAGSTLLRQEETAWANRLARIDGGESWATNSAIRDEAQ